MAATNRSKILHCLSRPSALRTTISFPSSRRHCTVGSGTPVAVHTSCVWPPSLIRPSSRAANPCAPGPFRMSGETTTSRWPDCVIFAQ